MADQPAELTVDCECGKSFPVSEGSAGARWNCECGCEVTVPSLAALRTSMGLSPIPQSTADMIRTKVAERTLPPSSCVCCHALGCETIPMVAVCEQESRGLAGLLEFNSAFVSLLDRGGRMELNTGMSNQPLGRELVLSVPIRLCSACRHRLPKQQTSRAVGIAKYVFGIATFVILVEPGWRWTALPFALIAVSLWFVDWTVKDRYFLSNRQLLSVVPEYDELFRLYPKAQVGIFPQYSSVQEL